MQNQCMFLTQEEKAIIEFLKDSPLSRSELVKKLKQKCEQNKDVKLKNIHTINKLLNELEAKKWIFRIKIDRKVFYKLNVFPKKIQAFFSLAEQLRWSELLDIKNEVLRKYPSESFEQILHKWRTYLELTKPQHKGIIQILKEFEENKLTFF